MTLQTLHPSKMDHGQILSQWPSGGLEIPNPNTIRPAELKQLLAPLAADMLVHGLRIGAYVPPLEDLTPQLDAERSANLREAPKILPEDLRIRWDEWTAERILRSQRVIGPLWNNIKVGEETIRVSFSDGFCEVQGELLDDNLQPGVPMLCLKGNSHVSAIWCKTADQKLLCMNRLKAPGHGEQASSTWARRMHLFNTEGSRDISIQGHGEFALAASRFD